MGGAQWMPTDDTMKKFESFMFHSQSIHCMLSSNVIKFEYPGYAPAAGSNGRGAEKALLEDQSINQSITFL